MWRRRQIISEKADSMSWGFLWGRARGTPIPPEVHMPLQPVLVPHSPGRGWGPKCSLASTATSHMIFCATINKCALSVCASLKGGQVFYTTPSICGSQASDLTNHSGKFSEDIGKGQEDASFQRLILIPSPNQNTVISDRITL